MVPSMVWHWRALMPINYLYIQLTYLSSWFHFLNPKSLLIPSQVIWNPYLCKLLMQTFAYLSSFILLVSHLHIAPLPAPCLASPFFLLSSPALWQTIIWIQCLWREQLKVSQVDPRSGLGEIIPLPLCSVIPAKPQDHFSTCSHWDG